MGGGYLHLEPMNFNESLSFSLNFHTFSTNNVELLWASNGVRLLIRVLSQTVHLRQILTTAERGDPNCSNL